MNILCAGLNHKTTSLSVRECFAVGEKEMESLLHQLRGVDGVSGAVMLSTCNRVELYTSSLCPLQTLTGIQKVLHKHSGIEVPLYHYMTPAAVRHLFRVASGLDSMVLGETEIFGQVKKGRSKKSKMFHRSST